MLIYSIHYSSQVFQLTGHIPWHLGCWPWVVWVCAIHAGSFRTLEKKFFSRFHTKSRGCFKTKLLLFFSLYFFFFLPLLWVLQSWTQRVLRRQNPQEREGMDLQWLHICTVTWIEVSITICQVYRHHPRIQCMYQIQYGWNTGNRRLIWFRTLTQKKKYIST